MISLKRQYERARKELRSNVLHAAGYQCEKCKAYSHSKFFVDQSGRNIEYDDWLMKNRKRLNLKLIHVRLILENKNWNPWDLNSKRWGCYCQRCYGKLTNPFNAEFSHTAKLNILLLLQNPKALQNNAYYFFFLYMAFLTISRKKYQIIESLRKAKIHPDRYPNQSTTNKHLREANHTIINLIERISNTNFPIFCARTQKNPNAYLENYFLHRPQAEP